MYRARIRPRLAPLAVAVAALCIPMHLAAVRAAPPSSGTVLRGVADLAEVSRLSGPGSLSHTDQNWAVQGADLGHIFGSAGHLYVVFGDTFGPGFTPPPDGNSGQYDMRSNTMGVVTDTVPAHGLPFASMITDRTGHAKALLPANSPGSPAEAGLIPTNGVAIGSRLYLHYMSVKSWDAPGHWTLNESGIASSSDSGQTWIKDPKRKWAGTSNWGQVAFVTVGKTLYLFGIPGGRYGSVKLAQVPAKNLLKPQAYCYYAGTHGHKVVWSPHEEAAAEVASGPVGELSVMWDAFLGRWIMTYLHDPSQTLVIREAPALWGPWSDPQALVPTGTYPAPYGAYLHPALTEQNGEIIYFTMSRWFDYSVYLMRARLLK